MPNKGFLFCAPDPDAWENVLKQIAVPCLLAIRHAVTDKLHTCDKTKDEFCVLIQYTLCNLDIKIDLLIANYQQYHDGISSNEESNKLSAIKTEIAEIWNQLKKLYHTLDVKNFDFAWLMQYDKTLIKYIERANSFLVYVKTVARIKKCILPEAANYPSGEKLNPELQGFYCSPLTLPTEFFEQKSMKYDEPALLGWKIHISVAQHDIFRAYEICLPLLRQHVSLFKIAAPKYLNNQPRAVLLAGGQITLYLENKGVFLQNKQKLHAVINIINQRLQEAHIAPGHYPSDLTLKNLPYFGLRNDINVKGEYIGADDSLDCYNPAGTKVPDALLDFLPEGVHSQLSLLEHFNTFKPKNIYDCQLALIACLKAFTSNNYHKNNKELFTNTGLALENEPEKKYAKAILRIIKNASAVYQIKDCPQSSQLVPIIETYNKKLTALKNDSDQIKLLKQHQIDEEEMHPSSFNGFRHSSSAYSFS